MKVRITQVFTHKVRKKRVRQEVFELPLVAFNRKSFTLVASHNLCRLYGSLMLCEIFGYFKEGGVPNGNLIFIKVYSYSL